MPLDVIRTKAGEFVGQGLLSEEESKKMIHAIEQERHVERISNSDAQADATASSSGDQADDLWKTLAEREENMKTGSGEGVPDQFRVYREIIESIQNGTPLRLFIQASAGTGTKAMHIDSR